MKPIKERLFTTALAALASCVLTFETGAQTPISLTEFQTVTFDGTFPAADAQSLTVFSDTNGAPFTTAAFVRSSTNIAANRVNRRTKLYLQFDLAGLTTDGIASATLDFSAYSLNDLTADVNNPDLWVSQSTSDWAPGGLPDPAFEPAITTSVNGGGVTSGTGTDLYLATTYRNVSTYSIDVTSIVGSWHTGATNNGFVLELDNAPGGTGANHNQGIGIDPTTLVLNVNQAPNPIATLSTATSPVAGTYTVDVNFNEDVTGLEDTDFTVTNGTASSLSGSGASYSITITPTDPGDVEVTLLADSVTATSGALSNLVSNTLVTHYIPPTQPFVFLTTPDPTVPGLFTVNVDFDQDVTGLEDSDFTVINGSITSLAGSGASYTITISPITSFEEVEVTLPADSVTATLGGMGNFESDTLFTYYDGPVEPFVFLSTSNALFAQFTVIVEFDEPVTGLEASDFDVVNGTASNVVGNGATYTVEITANGPGDVEVTLPADSVMDLDNNGLGNLASDTLVVTNNPADSALTNFANGDLNTSVMLIPGTTSGNAAISFDSTSNRVVTEAGSDDAGANQWILTGITNGFTYGPDSGPTGFGDGAFTGNGFAYNARPRAVFYFADDNKQSTGLLEFGMDVFFDDITAENPLQLLIEIYAWDDGQLEPLLSSGGPTSNDPIYNITDLGEAVTILNTRIPATAVTAATWETLVFGSADVGAGYDNYAWRIGVMGATLGDVFSFDNVRVTVGKAAPVITAFDRAANGDVTIDFTSSSGNVDVYRSTDLLDFGVGPIATDVAPGSYLDGTAAALPKAFYILVPTGDPAP